MLNIRCKVEDDFTFGDLEELKQDLINKQKVSVYYSSGDIIFTFDTESFTHDSYKDILKSITCYKLYGFKFEIDTDEAIFISFKPYPDCTYSKLLDIREYFTTDISDIKIVIGREIVITYYDPTTALELINKTLDYLTSNDMTNIVISNSRL